MPFPDPVREEALVRSQRCCCVCHKFLGRSAEVHHIIQEADRGDGTIENAIVLCPKCHEEAGHYNPRHPLGIKYSPKELRRHRNQWWKYCTQFPAGVDSPKPDFSNLPASLQDPAIQGGVRQLFIKTFGRAPSKQELYDLLIKTRPERAISYPTHEDLSLWEMEEKAKEGGWENH